MPDLPCVAHVAVEQPVDTLLDYLIPAEMQSRCAIGQRVLVPLGPRQVQGYIVGLAHRPSVADPKPLADVLDDSPLLTADLLQLTRWVAAYYMCPWGLVLKAAVPQGFRVRSETIYRLSPSAQAEPQNWPAGRAAELLHYVSQHGPQGQADLAQQLGPSPLGPLLRRLQTQGWLVAAQRRKRPAARQRMVSRVQLDLSESDAESLQHQLQRHAPSQAAVLAYLKTHPDCELSALQTEVPGARAAVKRLGERHAVRLTQVEQMRAVVSHTAFKPDVLPHLNQVQQHALRQIEVRLAAPDGVPILLHGVTGSGKTEVYMRAIATALQQDKTALVLVPEISLTAQAVERFAARFGSDIALLHSGLSTGERFDEWRRLLHGKARIAIGARSAVFAPLPKLGLIIIDEEHDTSYKQEETPRYNARDVAIVRAQQQQAVVVLGSATPALETFHHARSGKYLHLSMPQRIADKPLPRITLVDQRAHHTPNERVISTPLRDAIDSRLKRREQCLILINRRGFAAYLQCRECGDVPHCAQCSVSLTYHRLGRLLKCHYCDFSQPAPTACAVCQGPVLQLFGIGTQQVEDVLKTLFPHARLGRMDRDTTRGKTAHERILRAFGDGELDILVGTQMIAKGHDYPNITLVGVISADGALAIPDFRAPERLFQLLTQVAGRAGRGDLNGEVLIQTYRPEHDSVRFAREHDFIGFFREAIQDRQALLYPPYTRLAKVLLDSPVAERVEPASQWFAALLGRQVTDSRQLMILGPAEAPVAKIQNRYRWHILLKAASSRLLHECLQTALDEAKRDREHVRNVRISVDIDPVLFL
jgi:primosomal protein N' (replication factor Y)